MVASFDDLLGGDSLETEEFTLPNGLVVKLRGFTAYEQKLLYKDNFDENGNVRDLGLVMIRTVQYGFVEPNLTFDQAKQWMKSAKLGTVNAAVDRIKELSGMNYSTVDEAEKS